MTTRKTPHTQVTKAGAWIKSGMQVRWRGVYFDMIPILGETTTQNVFNLFEVAFQPPVSPVRKQLKTFE